MDTEKLLNNARRILGEKPPPMDEEYLARYIETYVGRRDTFLELVSEWGSPLYALDEDGLREDVARLKKAFARIQAGRAEVYFAVKSNNLPQISRIMVEEGVGLDVSSGMELETALALNSSRIIFSGPGKTDRELLLAIRNSDRVTVLIDSFGELDRLDRLTNQEDCTVRAGVRLTTRPDGLWRKFGIPLSRLREFFQSAETRPNIQLEGLQFHTSWNLTPDAQTSFIDELGAALKSMPENYLNRLRFVDIGGGYWPEQGEWLRAAGTAPGALRRMLSDGETDTRSRYLYKSTPIEEYAKSIDEALCKSLPKISGLRIFLEPGRWLCHKNLHLLLTVVDIKAPDLVITDAGTNIVGWERFEHDYFPVINLSKPGPTEHDCYIFGSLCTPHDVWGYSYYGESIEPGDLLLIPDQGAYTYSLRQFFIKPPPDAVIF